MWSYEGGLRHPFYSETCGAAHRLPNGNTLITETDKGRAFEVTESGEIVWEYYSPHRIGTNKELIASLLDVYRVKREYVSSWLNSE